MSKLCLFFAILIIASGSAHASFIETTSDLNGVTVHFNDARCYPKNILSDGKSAIVGISGDRHVDPLDYTRGYALPSVRVILAVPDVNMIEALFKNQRLEAIGGIEPATYNSCIDEIPEFGHAIDSPPAPGSIEPEIDIEYLGRRRGVEIVMLHIQPFLYDPDSGEFAILRNSSIRVDFGTEVAVETSSLSDEYDFFPDIDNPEHLSALKRKYATSKKTVPAVLKKTNWYDPEKIYYKLATSKDGIAVFDMSDLLAAAPELEGKDAQYLHLFFQGAEVPIKIEGGGGTVSGSGRIFFRGRRAAGDSTWYDHYTEKAVFYLNYDDSVPGERYGSLPEAPGASLIREAVTFEMHSETDNVYSRGKYSLESGTVLSEGWYWDGFYDMNSFHDFNYRQLLLATGDSIDIGAYFTSFRDTIRYGDNQEFYPIHRVSLIINEKQASQKEFQLIERESLNFRYPSDRLFYGFNKMEMDYNVANDIDDSLKKKVSGALGVDFFTYRGESLAHAFEGSAEFSLETESDTRLLVTGFSSPMIACLDENSGNMIFPESTSGTSLIAGGTIVDEPLSTLILNDSVINSSQSGFHIVYEAPDKRGEPVHAFLNSQSAAADLFGSLTDGSAVACVYNMPEQITDSKLKDFFAAMGSQIVSHQAGQAWAFVFETGASTIHEFIGENTSVKHFYEFDNGVSYRAELLLQPGEYSMMMNDLPALDDCAVEKVSQTDWHTSKLSADAIIVSHPDFIGAAEKLAAHRKVLNGLDLVVVNVFDLYKEFNYGKKSPNAIKDFLYYAYENWDKPPTHMILMGDASWDPKLLRATAVFEDLLPTHGNPASDYWYGLLDGDDFQPELIVGRIPANTIAQAEGYVQKIIEYDQLPAAPWMKDFLFISGGNDSSERDWFCESRLDWVDMLLGPEVCADTLSLCKSFDALVSEKQGPEIIRLINEGAIWTNYIGHGSAEYFDLDGWHAERLSNNRKWGILTTLSCNSGAFAEADVESRNEAYMINPDKGFIASIGGTAVGHVLTEMKIFYWMMNSFASNKTKLRRLGDILYFGKATLSTRSSDEYYAMQNYSLLGDPFARIKIDTVPDLYVYQSDIEVINEDGENQFSDADSIIIVRGVVYNAGICEYDSVKVLLERVYGDITIRDSIIFDGLCYPKSFELSVPINDMPGKHKLRVVIDPEGELADGNRDNNAFEQDVEVFTVGMIALDPLPFWDVDYDDPVFRLINPYIEEADYSYEFKLIDSETNEEIVSTDNALIAENYIDWTPDLVLEKDKKYYLSARLINETIGEKPSDWLTIPFTAREISDSEKVSFEIASANELSLNEMENLAINEDNRSIGLARHSKTFSSLGAGFTGRWLYMEIDGVVYKSGEFFRGLNLLMYNSLTGETRFRNWDTYFGIPDSGRAKNRELIAFLRDSVQDEEYIMLSSNDPAFVYLTGAADGEKGSIDTLAKVLKDFGSTLHEYEIREDSLYFLVYSFAGWRGARPDQTYEAFTRQGDSAFIHGKFFRYDMQGSFTSRKIGPAKEWNSLEVEVQTVPESSTITLSIIAFPQNGGDPVIFAQGEGVWEFDLSGLDATEYPYIELNAQFERTDRFSEPEMHSLNAEFTPEAEMAFVKSETEFVIDSLMRGETASGDFTVENIGRRSSSGPFKIAVLRDQQTDSLNFDDIEPDSRETATKNFDTRFFDLDNTLEYEIDSDKNLNELYLFNNFADGKVYLYEDAVPPVFSIRADSAVLENNDYISAEPLLEIRMMDNSPLPLEGESNIKVKINGLVQKPSNTQDYKLSTDPDPLDRDLKILLSFIPDSLDFGQSWIEVSGKDATGNRDTLFIYVNVQLLGEFKDVQGYPNPFSDAANIGFEFRGPENAGQAEILIYNSLGQLVSRIVKPLRIGRNEAAWNGLDDRGRSIPSGAYYYMLKYIGNFYVEPVSGQLIYLR